MSNVEAIQDAPEKGKPKSIEIEVNSKPVLMEEKVVTGLEIKQAAIKQGVAIEANFVLQEELPNGSVRIVGDGDQVKIHPHISFTAIRPDDNS